MWSRYLPWFGLLVLVVSLAACVDSTDEAADTTLAATTAAAPSTSTAPSTTATSATTITTITTVATPEIAEVTSTASGCTMSGATDVDPGDHWFLFIEESDNEVEYEIRAIDADHTYDDIVAAQGTPGEVFGRPLWISDAMHSFASPPDIDTAPNETLRAWTLSPGEYFVRSYTLSTPPDGHKYLWLCGGINVTEP